MVKPDEYYVMRVVLDDIGVFRLETINPESELNNVYLSQEEAYRDIQDCGEPAHSYVLIPSYVCLRDEKNSAEYLEGQK